MSFVARNVYGVGLCTPSGGLSGDAFNAGDRPDNLRICFILCRWLLLCFFLKITRKSKLSFGLRPLQRQLKGGHIVFCQVGKVPRMDDEQAEGIMRRFSVHWWLVS